MPAGVHCEGQVALMKPIVRRKFRWAGAAALCLPGAALAQDQGAQDQGAQDQGAAPADLQLAALDPRNLSALSIEELAQVTVESASKRPEPLRRLISGPGGSLYGPNAVNGVINVISRDARDTVGALARGTVGALEPFFTIKGPGKGTGLGLSQVYGFATQSGGALEIASRPGEGTVVTILLPRSDSDPAAPEAAPAALDRTREGSILLVEDHDEVAEFADGLLTELGYSVVRACDGEQALERLGEREFDVVFSDVVMPGMSGIALADELAVRAPRLPVILTTGFSPEIAVAGARRPASCSNPTAR